MQIFSCALSCLDNRECVMPGLVLRGGKLLLGRLRMCRDERTTIPRRRTSVDVSVGIFAQRTATATATVTATGEVLDRRKKTD